MTEQSDFVPLSVAVLTVSDTRTEADDRSGRLLAERLATGRPPAIPPRPRGRPKGGEVSPQGRTIPALLPRAAVHRPGHIDTPRCTVKSYALQPHS